MKNSLQIKGFDIIGDVHGHAQDLFTLLNKLGYQKRGNVYSHPERIAIFVGDYIDRGLEQVAVLETVREMVNCGHAMAILGNHELNAIGWHKVDAGGEYLRPHTEKNRHQHSAFLSQVGENSASHDEWVDWFLSLPVWLELPTLQVVHACWHPDAMLLLQPWLDNGRLPRQNLLPFFEKKHVLFHAIEAITKGVELALPEGFSFFDKDGHCRTSTRMKWWSPKDLFCDQALMPGELAKQLPRIRVPEEIALLSQLTKPTFIGHYWLTGIPALQSEYVVCLDYSVAKGGKLVAYRYDVGEQLHPKQFIWIDA